MEVIVRGVGGRRFEKDEAREVVRCALQRIAHRVQRARVYLEDINGPRGGVDKMCLCVLQPPRMRPVVVRGRGTSVLPLLHRVANRAVQTLQQRSGRRRTTRRRSRLPSTD